MKVRTYIISSLLLGGLLNFSACTLDYDPVDTYSDVTEGVQDESGDQLEFQSKADVESALEALYQKMKDRMEHWYLDLVLTGDTHADNAYAGTTGAEALPFENNSIEGGNSVLARDWERYLQDVADANRIICNIDAVPDESFSTADRQSIKAQAEIFRALIWFDMVRIWGNIPVITTVAPDITEDNVEDVYQDYFPSQSSAVDAYKQIEADLLDALKYAPDNTGDKTQFTKSVARALLAKVYAEKPLQDYTKVIQYCNELQEDGFKLVENFGDLFDVKLQDDSQPVGPTNMAIDLKYRNTVEAILEAQFPAAGGNWCAWMFGRTIDNWNYSFEWAKWVTPSRDLIALYNREGDTERFNQSVVYYECRWSNYYPSNNYPFMYKCRSGQSSIIYLRYADLLLLKAEAYLRGTTKDLGAAADIIDDIRARAGLKPLAESVRSSESALWEAYKNERRMELAFEGQRWFDLCRWDEVENVMNNLKDEGRFANVNAYDANSYLLPIPQTALDGNENLVQNPGY